MCLGDLLVLHLAEVWVVRALEFCGVLGWWKEEGLAR